MASPGVDLYNTAYGNYERDLRRRFRPNQLGDDRGVSRDPAPAGAHFRVLSLRDWLRFGRLRIAPGRDLPLQRCWLGPERPRNPKCERSSRAEEAGRALPVPTV